MFAILAILLPLALMGGGCGGDDTGASDVRESQERLEVIRALTGEEANRSLASLAEAETLLSRDLPVRAGDMLEAGALPAIERHLETLQSLRVFTPGGRALRDEAVTAVEERKTSVAHYRRILARGLLEDFEFVQASAAQRQAEETILALVDRVLAENRPEAEEEEDEAPPQIVNPPDDGEGPVRDRHEGGRP